MSEDDFKAALVAAGYRIAAQGTGGHNKCGWYAYRRTGLAANECETNGNKSDQTVVRPWISEHTPLAVEIETTSQSGGMWFRLQAYGLGPDEVIARLPEIEARLIAAWNAASNPTQ